MSASTTGSQSAAPGAAGPGSQTPTPGGRRDRRWWVLAVVLAAFFMTMLDTTIVNVAIPSIQTGLHASYSSVQWVVSGYALAYGLVLVPSGRIGDRFGHRRLFLVSLAGFALSSLLCGTASSPTELVVWRVVQGAMAGVLNPQMLATVQVAFTGRERGRAFGFYGATAGVGTAAGPLLGGALIAADLHGLDWRPIFLLNVPIGAAALLAAVRLLPDSRGRGGDIDRVGFALVAAALLALLYPLVQGRAAGWPAWSIAALAASGPLLAAFALFQRRRIRLGRSPLIDIRLFARRAFTAGTALSLVYFAGFTSVFFSLSLWLQSGLGRSALAAGLTIVPFAVGSFFGSAISDRVAVRLGSRVLSAATAMVLVGLGATLLTIHLAGAGVAGALLAPSLLFAGFGSGLTIAPTNTIVLARVPEAEAGGAGGVLQAAKRVGTSLGIAVVGVILFGSLPSGASAGAATDVSRAALAHGFTTAVQRALLFNIGAVAVAFLLSLVVPRHHDDRGAG